MIEPNGQRAVKAIEVQQLATGNGVHQPAPAAFLQIHHNAEAVEEDVPFHFGHDALGRDPCHWRKRPR